VDGRANGLRVEEMIVRVGRVGNGRVRWEKIVICGQWLVISGTRDFSARDGILCGIINLRRSAPPMPTLTTMKPP
jgi:hypothetical protein